ncbi:MAG TPA: hemerythrin domain-containing protein [Xanthobacteraceae bacterium]|nr:hemerythrin domain-containing protein [Xanthobacteraceae bacterium]
MTRSFTRRALIGGTPGLVAAGALASRLRAEAPLRNVISPTEDLMREHGVLDRVLLVYEAALARFAAAVRFDLAVLAQAAGIVRDFIEGYHERNEEQALFPRFRKAGRMTRPVDVLYQQHRAGRRLTDSILALVPASAAAGDDRRVAGVRRDVSAARGARGHRAFSRAPRHRVAARARRHGRGLRVQRAPQARRRRFPVMVARVGDIEAALGIHDLAKATPPA